jgi:hypothetical protein
MPSGMEVMERLVRDELRAMKKSRDSKKPCGECHLQLGETCDICGAVRPAATQPAPQAGEGR